MQITGQSLFAFVDLKDPFMPTAVAGEDQPGPILSILSARSFDVLCLFATPHTRENAEATRREVQRRHPHCRVFLRELPVSDPKDYSAVLARLAREVRSLSRTSPDSRNFVCVSSGTAEMRAAWFLLTATGVLPATLLQVGSPAEPLFGAANVREVRMDEPDWSSLRDLVMPRQYFEPPTAPASYELEPLIQPARAFRTMARLSVAHPCAEPAPPEPASELDDALRELGIYVGSSLMRHEAERAAVVATTSEPVLLLGETGTGKEMFARLIHRLSGRRKARMVTVNCAAIPKDLAESYLFGHLKGSFTGATQDHAGKFRDADGGTLFLDEIGELTPEIQAKLLRVVEYGVVEPLGSSESRPVNVRIIAATNRNIQSEVGAGRFREDLYHRLSVLQIQLPALRDRRAEIPLLAAELLRNINQRSSRNRQISPEALKRLERYDWPGNVRDLANVLKRSALFAKSDELAPEDILIVMDQKGHDPFATLPEPAEGFSVEDFLAKARRHLYLRALARANNNQAAAAELLGVSKQAVNKFVTGLSGNAG